MKKCPSDMRVEGCNCSAWNVIWPGVGADALAGGGIDAPHIQHRPHGVFFALPS